MKYSIKSLLILLVALGFILSCAQAPQQVAENTLVSPADIATQKAKDSTVRLVNRFGDSVRFSSGFFVEKDKIATNIHVVARPGPIFAKLNDKKTIWAVEGVTAYDIEYDIVVLKLAGEGTPLPLGDSDTVQSGEPVVAVGYPGRKYKVTAGNVHGIRNSDKLLGTTTNCSKGSSGGLC